MKGLHSKTLLRIFWKLSVLQQMENSLQKKQQIMENSQEIITSNVLFLKQESTMHD